MVKKVDFRELFEGEEVEDFLNLFVRPEIEGMPKNIDKVLEDVSDFWNENGFTTPAELKVGLIEKYLGDETPAEVKNIVRNIELASNSGEKVTGYLGREHAYIATGLAHLYSKLTDKPIAVAEIDFSNMGGTNEHFRKLIANELEVGPDNIPSFAGESLTDIAASVVAGGIISKLTTCLPEGAAIVPVRSGGDELRIFFTGMTGNANLQHMVDQLHTRIEYLTAKMGLHDHKHAKAPNNKYRNGFGAALTIKNMADIDNPDTISHELDAEIKGWKYVLGRIRFGGVDDEFAKTEVSMRYRNGLIAPAEGQSYEDFEDKQIALMRERLQYVSAVLQSIKPDKNENGIKFVTDFAERTLKTFTRSPVKMEKLDPRYDLNQMPREMIDEVVPMSSLSTRREYLIDRNLRDAGVELNNREKYLLSVAEKDFTARDPSSGAYLPHEIINALNVYKNDIPDLVRMVEGSDMKDTGVESAKDIRPYLMGVSFHGLASLNDLLGHHTADVVLKHWTHKVIEKSIKDVGIDNKGDEAFMLAHHGGGNFSVLFKPVTDGSANLVRAYSEKDMEKISTGIYRNLNEFRTRNIADFLAEGGHEDGIKAAQESGIKTFNDIEDSKPRTFAVRTGDISARVKGMHVTVTHKVVEYDLYKKGDEMIRSIRESTDASLNKLRELICISEAKKQQTSPVVKRGLE